MTKHHKTTRAFALLLIALLPLSLCAEEPLEEVRQRLHALEFERLDYRRPDQGTLPEDKELERQRLMGILYVRDPLWRLQEELRTQLTAVLELHGMEGAMPELECLREALASSTVLENEENEVIREECDRIRVFVLRKEREALRLLFDKYR